MTGASGFIGSFLSRHLREEGFELVLAVRSEEQRKHFSGEGFEVLVGDLMDVATCERLVSKVDVVIHLAHSNAPLRTAGDAVNDMVQNLAPSVNLLETIKRASRPIRLIYASSGGTVYGRTGLRSPFRETDPCLPITAYGIQKFTIENYIIHYSNLGHLDSDILRISNPYGVPLPSTRNQGLIGVVFGNIKERRPITIFGDPDNVRDYVHLDDLGAAFEACLTRSGPGGIFNIGSGVGHSVNEVLRLIEDELGSPLERHNVLNEDTKSLCDWTVLDVARAHSELGWTPEVSLLEGLQRMSRDFFGDSNG